MKTPTENNEIIEQLKTIDAEILSVKNEMLLLCDDILVDCKKLLQDLDSFNKNHLVVSN